MFFFCKQKAAYEVRIRDGSADVCSSDLPRAASLPASFATTLRDSSGSILLRETSVIVPGSAKPSSVPSRAASNSSAAVCGPSANTRSAAAALTTATPRSCGKVRSEAHTSELQSLMRLSYAVFCLKKKKQQHKSTPSH